MGRVLHVRLDEDTERAIGELRQRIGAKDSELVRRGLKLLAAQNPPGSTPRVVGLGEFASGVGDLAANKSHLAGLGRKPQ